MAGSLRLMLHQCAHRFSQPRDVLPEGSQVRGEVSGSAFSALAHEFCCATPQRR